MQNCHFVTCFLHRDSLWVVSSSVPGPSVIEIINSLLEHIRSSVVCVASGKEGSEEKMYQETLIQALGEYAQHLPDYQKIDSMVFILNKVRTVFISYTN